MEVVIAIFFHIVMYIQMNEEYQKQEREKKSEQILKHSTSNVCRLCEWF